MTTRFADHLLGPDDHASRPAAGDVPQGTLYVCTDHNKIYKSDGSSTWSDWWSGSAIADILDLTTAETDDALVLAPDGAGGVEFRAEAGGGGGGGTFSYLGYDTIGGSTEDSVIRYVYAKKVTVASAGILLDIEAYVEPINSSDTTFEMWAALYSDNSGTPDRILSTSYTTTGLLDNTPGGGGSTPRWYGRPISRYVTAADYWIAITCNTGAMRMRKDGSGADRRYQSGFVGFADWGFYSPTTLTDRFSIRAGFLEL